MADVKAMGSIGWYYNWDQAPVSIIADSLKGRIDYVPMTWGKNFNREDLRSYLTQHPEIKYLLGFNEPNFIEQANLGPKAAAALWPDIQEIADEFDLQLVSPALNFSYSGGAVMEDGIEYTDPIQYLDSFFIALPVGSRVDYVAIHGYFDNAGAWPWYVDLYDKYEKPLWITEFNHSAESITETSQQNYLVDALDYFENEPKVFRYAWFLARSPQTNTNLFLNDTPGGLTDLGIIFTNMSTYDTSYYHDTHVPVEAQHYADMSGIHLVVNDDTSGILSAHDFDMGDWMDYNIDVPVAGTYSANFRIASIWDSNIKIYKGESMLCSLDLPTTGGPEIWKTYSINIELEAGKQTLRLMPGGGGYRLNWWSLGNPVAITDVYSANVDFKLFPNPATDFIIIKGMVEGEKMFRLFDITGKELKNINTSGREMLIYLEDLKSGTYMIKISGRHFMQTKQITKK